MATERSGVENVLQEPYGKGDRDADFGGKWHL